MLVSRDITIGANPIQVSTLDKAVSNFWVQMKTGGTGLGYLFNGIPDGITPTLLTYPYTEIEAASAGGPGGTYFDEKQRNLKNTWVHGAHAGDVATITYRV